MFPPEVAGPKVLDLQLGGRITVKKLENFTLFRSFR